MTTLITKTTKKFYQLERDQEAMIDVGGVQVPVSRAPFDPKMAGGKLAHLTREAIRHAEVTVTNEREMLDRDLEPGDCFVSSYPDDRIFFVWVWVDVPAKALRVEQGQTSLVTWCVDDVPVTLVNPTFEAEPLEEERTVPVHKVGAGRGFDLAGESAIATGVPISGFRRVVWDKAGKASDLPKDTPVTVHEPANYESWHDVSVGDVFLFDEKAPGIYLGNGKGLTPDGRLSEVINPANLPSDLTPARLTDVSWKPIHEVER